MENKTKPSPAWWRCLSPIFFLSRADKERLVQAIRTAESQTSGEIRLHLDRRQSGHIVEHAKKVFEKLGMTRTRYRNGVLVYLAVDTKRFAILGDIGIHEKVTLAFWKSLAESVEKQFKEGCFADGLIFAINAIGAELQKHFPSDTDDRNELRDEISYSL
jgi:uncharacterized membrane protein